HPGRPSHDPGARRSRLPSGVHLPGPGRAWRGPGDPRHRSDGRRSAVATGDRREHRRRRPIRLTRSPRLSGAITQIGYATPFDVTIRAQITRLWVGVVSRKGSGRSKRIAGWLGVPVADLAGVPEQILEAVASRMEVADQAAAKLEPELVEHVHDVV